MRWVIQRVQKANVKVNNEIVGEIRNGLLVLCGIEEGDESNDSDWLINKMLKMRIFSDENEKMNLSVHDISGEILLVSQFTLHAQTAKGNRPSFIRAANPEKAKHLYEYTLNALSQLHPNKISSGQFGKDMQISCLLDGPVTIIIDSKNRE